MRGRVFYCGMINTTGYGKIVGSQVFVGAGSRKMTSVSAALRTHGVNTWIVSLPVLGRTAKRASAPATILRDETGPGIFLKTWRNRWARKFLSMIWFGFFCARKVRPQDSIILYNYCLEHLLGLIVLRLRRIKTILDIEDLPRRDLHKVLGLMQLALLSMFINMTMDRKLVASKQIARNLFLKDAFPLYGISFPRETSDSVSGRAHWDKIAQGGPLRVHFGGTLNRDTGLFVFLDAIKALQENHPSLAGRFSFFLTGSLDERTFMEVSKVVSESRGVEVKIFNNIDRDEYREIFSSCHTSLSLRLPGADYSMGTFPSKVVEIVEAERLLITTLVSDLAEIFDDESAVFLHDASGEALADALVDVLLSPLKMKDKALNGSRKGQSAFSPVSVSSGMKVHFNLPGRSS